jgi:xylulokinase
VTLVAGVDSSTQSCKVVVRDADSGALIRQGRAPHPPGTEVHPHAWWDALQQAVEATGGLDDVAAVSVAGQQHGMVCLDEDGEVVRPALLWNDTRSADAAAELVAELGAEAWAEAVGLVPVASFTVTKLRWLATNEPESAGRTAAVCLPHDWLSWRLGGRRELEAIATDRGDASGTGYWSPAQGRYVDDLIQLALREANSVSLPTVLDPTGSCGETRSGAVIAAGTGDNMAAALGVGAEPGDVIVSIGTSGVICSVSDVPTSDASGTVAGFADATGRFLPLACTLNGAQVLDTFASVLGVDAAGFDSLALGAAAGAGGLVLVPYLGGERTPNLPDATGALHGIRLDNLSPPNIARAAVEGILCGLAAACDAVTELTGPPRRLLVVGGAANSAAVRDIAPSVFGQPVTIPEPGEHVANGAARQAAWALAGGPAPPAWPDSATATVEAEPQPVVRDQYRRAASMVVPRAG